MLSRRLLINPDVASDAVKKIASKYPIQKVMTFWSEPLLYSDAVYQIYAAALEMGATKRQVIKNSYFTKDISRMVGLARGLAGGGINDLLLSADAFHQETIPLDTVGIFAAEVLKNGIPMRLQPACPVSPEDDNLYNVKMRELLDSFRDIGFFENEGNIIIHEGNVLRFLGEYFTLGFPENPYAEDPTNMRCVSFGPSGDVRGDKFSRLSA